MELAVGVRDGVELPVGVGLAADVAVALGAGMAMMVGSGVTGKTFVGVTGNVGKVMGVDPPVCVFDVVLKLPLTRRTPLSRISTTAPLARAIWNTRC